MKTRTFIGMMVMLTALVSMTACSNDGKEEISSPDVPDIDLKLVEPKERVDVFIPAEMVKVNDAVNQFSLKFFNQMVKQLKVSSNIIVSPFSAQAALAMTANGAKGGTLDEMLAALNMKGFSLDEINSYNQNIIKAIADLDNTTFITSANGIWSKVDLLDAFCDKIQTAYDAKIEKTDFGPETIAAINDWAYEKTYGMIPRLFDTDEEVNSTSVLANALYFNGVWAKPFDSTLTVKDTFNNADKSTATLTFMKEGGYKNFLSCETFDLCDKPYGNGAFSMVFLLPHKDVTLNKAIGNLAQMDWKGLTANLMKTSVRVNLTVPKFELKDMSYDLIPMLKEMGMLKAFTGVADFSNMTDKAAFTIDKVDQKTALMLNEQGTQCAAITMIKMGATLNDDDEPDPVCFPLNRPFAFFIKERSTGVILFAGAMNKL